MKKKNFFLIRKTQMAKSLLAFCLCFFLVGITSCIKGYDEDNQYTSGVTNTTLVSPNADGITFLKSPDGTSVKIEWPVVFGAGGYEVSFYIADDPENLELVGEENEIVDGCFIIRPLLEDTKYQFVVKALGNERYNNKTAETATLREMSTLVEATMIPDGTDLSDFFANNPIVDNGEEIAYELAAGGNYTISSRIDLGRAYLTLRGDKVNRPTVVAGAGFRSLGGGNKFKFINFECEGMTGNAFYGFDDIDNSGAVEEVNGTNRTVIVRNPIMFQECNFAKLPQPLLFDDNKPYAVSTFIVDNCVVELTNNGRFYRNQAGYGALKDFTISNSTVYKTNTGGDQWMQLGGQGLDRFGWASGSQTYINNTFYGFNHMHNSNNYSRTQAPVTVTVKNNLFLDFVAGDGDPVARRILPGGNRNNKTVIFDTNTYWKNGAAEPDHANDPSGTALKEDPGCQDPANGNFKVTNANTIAAGIGDPRWW